MSQAALAPVRTSPVPLLHRVATRLVLRQLGGWRAGALTMVLPDGQRVAVGDGAAQPHVTVTVRDWRFFWRVLLAGDVGAGESYMAGEWAASDLVALCRMVLLGVTTMDTRAPWTVAARVRHAALRWLRRNSLPGSRRNIRHHYDLSNALYATFLDDAMLYSCATFADADTSLAVAQQRKIDDVCRRLALRPGMRLLEIGCGWGALAIHAARTYGVTVTALTLSEQQLVLARERVAAAGLADRVDVLLCDYRHVEGPYDRIVSIEMFEAVGYEYFATFFARAAALLTPTGQMLLQVITIPDQRFDDYRRTFDFIRKHIFPGGCCPSLFEMQRAAKTASDFRLVWARDIGPDYARTLAAWRTRFVERVDEVRALGFDEIFVRMWEYYLASCEAAFATRHIGDHQLLFARPLAGLA